MLLTEWDPAWSTHTHADRHLADIRAALRGLVGIDDAASGPPRYRAWLPMCSAEQWKLEVTVPRTHSTNCWPACQATISSSRGSVTAGMPADADADCRDLHASSWVIRSSRIAIERRTM